MSRSAATSNVQSTPSSRANADTGLDERAKKRVRGADPNLSRCLVENCVETKAVEFCHCFPRSMSYARNRHVLDRIEWFWNMEHRTLNLDTRQNIFRAGASVHYLFDQHHWLLLPDPDVVDKYRKSLTEIGRQAIRELFPIIEADRNIFKYRFIPVSPEMKLIPLIRQNDKPDAIPRVPTANDISIHLFPFRDMPLLESHVHPKFVILETGRKLRLIKPKLLEDLGKAYSSPAYNQIRDIYDAWTAPLPEDAYHDETFNYKVDPDGSNPGDGTSDRTARRRVEDPNARKRLRQDDPNDSPSPAPKQGGQGQQTLKRSPSLCLSKKSLELHDEKSGGKKWTDDAVRDWSKQCRHPLPASVHAPWNPTEICV